MTTSSIQIAGAEDFPTRSTGGYAHDGIEELRLILAREQCRVVAYDEAAIVGESLIEFFEVLAAVS